MGSPASRFPRAFLVPAFVRGFVRGIVTRMGGNSFAGSVELGPLAGLAE